MQKAQSTAYVSDILASSNYCKEFLVFMWRQKKLKLKILSFYLYQVKAIFKDILGFHQSCDKN